ncbi:MAG: hypothetical protein A2Y03_01795 [Omnitrophica WOR_2 bacterium GWF2_38_59]|nr:MAG: hypothetical protein A2Y03_01795 [Omnitrophica WOR_2 bacterium GWF2_38_59]OGX50918.1 MAG: hypothetical protein A2243_06505 [Omnitrophica WOR_2 bacterium RIFOXYA2_FULL_38_17]OGX55313.1 MAG: hypothetical protein A2447_00780 [Omnitrophica WOR_2 bacterium RIFOXYC2_FULL_38_12]OGX60564.1 MAG: hypothetical protein A2306_03130 [Omnitrophica WOR_2 bacterium RIFOXYB2_FULL_38_16]HBG61700.1 hypothetical protein [Candidatus Omnitrophota bacterium]
MLKQISKELQSHMPFTILGALSGIFLIAIFQKIPTNYSYTIFYVLHPLHVVLSALVTAAMYKLHTCEYFGSKCLKGKCNLWILLIVGYVGSVGIATISDSVIPYIGESLLNMPNRGSHIGFIEKWWLVNPLAILGIIIAYFWSSTKFPHAGHVLISTWASLFHVIMAVGKPLYWFEYIVIFLFLFIAVWIPCCFSDIVFPLLFIKKNSKE